MSCFAPVRGQNARMSPQFRIRIAVRAFWQIACWIALLNVAVTGQCGATAEGEAKDPAVAAPAADDITNAIWKDQELDFTYHSSNNIYSCGALRSRVKSLLRAVGADSLEVSVSGCEEILITSADELQLPGTRSGQPTDRLRERQLLRDAQFARVRIKLRTPIPATPEVLAELDKTKGYRELLGRVTGSSDAVQEAASQFPARRQQISLSTRKLDLEPEDCELIEQMIAAVFPKLQVRVVKQNLSCFPPFVSKLKPRLEVEALVRTTSEVATPPK